MIMEAVFLVVQRTIIFSFDKTCVFSSFPKSPTCQYSLFDSSLS